MMIGFDRVLEEMNGRDSKKVGNNSYLKKLDDGRIGYLLHNTYIAKFGKGDVTLDSGGWLTHTTKDRMNQALAMVTPYGISQEKGNWYIVKNDGNWSKIAPYYDGMKISYSKELVPTLKGEKELAKRNEIKKENVAEYNELKKKIENGVLSNVDIHKIRRLVEGQRGIYREIFIYEDGHEKERILEFKAIVLDDLKRVMTRQALEKPRPMAQGYAHKKAVMV